MQDGSAPPAVADFRFDPNALRDITPRQRAIYRGTISLILGAGGGARDFHSQAFITGQLMLDEGIDDHHIFPAAYVERTHGTPQRTRDSVLNRTLIDRTTNQVISDRAPSAYLADIMQTPEFPFDLVMSSHLLPIGADSPMMGDDFEGFLAWRQARLWQAIQAVTGAVAPADLEAAAT